MQLTAILHSARQLAHANRFVALAWRVLGPIVRKLCCIKDCGALVLVLQCAPTVSVQAGCCRMPLEWHVVGLRSADAVPRKYSQLHCGRYCLGMLTNGYAANFLRSARSCR